MAKYLLEDREYNGYEDSDFYAVYYDTVDGLIKNEEYGSTRGPSPRTAPASEYLKPTEEILPTIRKVWATAKAKQHKAFDDRRVLTPGPKEVSRGSKVVLLADGTWKDKKTGTVVTYKKGDKAEVFWVGQFGQFYHNGYKQPNRGNTRLGLKLQDGRTLFLSMEKVQLDAALVPLEEYLDTYDKDAATMQPGTGNGWVLVPLRGSCIFLP